MQPPDKPIRSLTSRLSIIAIAVAIVLILLLINSGWKIGNATVKVGPIEVELQRPTDTVLLLQTPPQTTISLAETPLALSPTTHAPIVLWIDEREEYVSGRLYLYKDIHFIDSAGDAKLVIYEVIQANIAGLYVSNDNILSSPADQKIGTYVTATWNCGNGGVYTIILEAQIFDEDGNHSEPFRLTFNCR